MGMQEHFDVIVAGGGTAGCVLAARLSEDPHRSVLLLEAGPDYGPFARGGWPDDLLDADADADLAHDWGFDGPSATRAKVIGGCSSHNECVVAWAPPDDHRSWVALGDHGWSFDRQRPLLEGAQALLKTRTAPTRHLEDAFLRAAGELSLPILENMNGSPWGPGAAVLPRNVVDAVRWNAAFAYLDAARDRPNLTIQGNTLVDRVTFTGATVRGLSGELGGVAATWTATTVVLCAGTYMTPAILQRSGIGPAQALRGLGLEPIVDLPGVGANLRDHPMIEVSFAAEDAVDPAQTGDLQNVMLKARSRLCGDEHWDTHVLLLVWHPDDGGRVLVIFYIAAVESDSVGRISLRSADPHVLPEIQQPFSALTDHDASLLAEGTELVRRLASTEALDAFVDEEVEPGVVDDLEGWIRANVAGYWHPVGTCRIGPADDPAAVVGPAGRVHGTEGLVVADASIFPTAPRANTNLPTIGIAELIASSIL
jgi:choline dehydrogenase-like flavoprotein